MAGATRNSGAPPRGSFLRAAARGVGAIQRVAGGPLSVRSSSRDAQQQGMTLSRRHTVVGQQAEVRGMGGEGTLHRRLSEPIVPGTLLPPPVIFEPKCCQSSCQTEMEASDLH